MPRHEFRTIEEFVKLLETYKADAVRAARQPTGNFSSEWWRGKDAAYEAVLRIIRNSNLGIVYPPAEQGDKS